MKKTWRNICFLLLAVLILAGYPQITHAAVSEAYGDYTVYNVTEYGADPTGAQACDFAISSALRAARKNSGKKLLHFPAGSYTSPRYGTTCIPGWYWLQMSRRL